MARPSSELTKPEAKKIAILLDAATTKELIASAAKNTRTVSQEARHLIKESLKERVVVASESTKDV